MTKLRAQIGLVFDDENLFHNFIEPFKQQRELNNVIIRCLSAYYYNDEIRGMIEGISLEDVRDSESEVMSSQEICDNIRQSLMIQDFLATELQSTIDDGSEDIDNILNKTNDLAEASEVAKPTKNEFGKGVLKLETKKLSTGLGSEIDSDSIEDISDKQLVKLMFKAILKMAEDSGNSAVLDILNVRKNDESDIDTSDMEKIEIQSDINEVVMTNDSIEEEISEPEEENSSIPVSESIVSTNTEVIEEVKEVEPVSDIEVEIVSEPVVEPIAEPVVEPIAEPVVEPTIESTSGVGDARSSMLDLLGSLT